jgi:hypothetical protein
MCAKMFVIGKLSSVTGHTSGWKLRVNRNCYGILTSISRDFPYGSAWNRSGSNVAFCNTQTRIDFTLPAKQEIHLRIIADKADGE